MILYSAVEEEQHFRVVAIRGAPRSVSDDLRTFGFRPDNAPRLYEQLEGSGAVELGPDPGTDVLPRTLMERWNVTAALVQSVTRKDRIIGLLCCCYTGWRGPFTEPQRRLLAAIAREAAVALDNARVRQRKTASIQRCADARAVRSSNMARRISLTSIGASNGSPRNSR